MFSRKHPQLYIQRQFCYLLLHKAGRTIMDMRVTFKITWVTCQYTCIWKYFKEVGYI
jgi:hypothetical protein